MSEKEIGFCSCEFCEFHRNKSPLNRRPNLSELVSALSVHFKEKRSLVK